MGVQFSARPTKWPEIDVVESDSGDAEVTATAHEIEMLLDSGQERIVRMSLLGFPLAYDAGLSMLRAGGELIPLPTKDGLVRLHCVMDDDALELSAGGCVYRFSPAGSAPRVAFETDGNTACLARLRIFGLRAPGYERRSAEEIAATSYPNETVYENGAFRIFPNHVEDRAYGEPPAYVPCRDVVFSPTRVTEEFPWRHTPWGDMTRVINRSDRWEAPASLGRFPDLHTGIPTFDAAYRIALDVLNNAADPRFALAGERGMWSAGAFQGEGMGFGVWRRDSAQIILKCAALYDGAVTANTLRHIFFGGFDNGADGIPMPIMALGDYFLATGDRALAKSLWECVAGGLERADALFDQARGLCRAPRSSSNDAFDEPEAGGYALSTQVYFMAAYEAGARMAGALGEDAARAQRWEKRAALLRENIRALYWNPEYGYYTSGPEGSESYEKGYWETCGQECALWDKFDIARPDQKASILARLPKTAMTSYGIALMPYRADKNHFTSAVWPVYCTGFAQAAAQLGRQDLLLDLIAQQVRAAVMNKTFYEVLDSDSGLTWRWPSQTWHAAGFISMFLYGVFGVSYAEDGLSFNPCVPEKLRDICLNGLRYRGARLEIAAHGWGRLERMAVDGCPVRLLQPGVEGNVKIDLFMSEGEGNQG